MATASASNVVAFPAQAASGAEVRARNSNPCMVPECERKRNTGPMCFRHAREFGVTPDLNYHKRSDVCTVCKDPNKPRTTEFFSRRGKNGPLKGTCKDCRNAKAKTSEGRSAKWKQGLKYKFSITPEFYFRLLSEQDGRCAICRTVDPGGRGKDRGTWCVDHDHATGRVRSLLCTNCNVAIGNLRDSSAITLAAAVYLEKHGR